MLKITDEASEALWQELTASCDRLRDPRRSLLERGLAPEGTKSLQGYGNNRSSRPRNFRQEHICAKSMSADRRACVVLVANIFSVRLNTNKSLHKEMHEEELEESGANKRNTNTSFTSKSRVP